MEQEPTPHIILTATHPSNQEYPSFAVQAERQLTPPSFQPLPSHTIHPDLKDYTDIPDCPLPVKAKDVIWPGEGIKTKLPFIADPQNPDINLLQNVLPF